MDLNFIDELPAGFIDEAEYLAKLEEIRQYVIYTHVVSAVNTIADSIGRAYQLGTWTNRTIRTVIANDLMDNTLNQMEQYGHDLVFSSYLTDSSELCQPWQNHIYSKNGTSTIYKPLFDALWRNGGGLIHPNCRHRLSPWIEGLSELEDEIPLADVKKNQKAREEYMRIRNQKRKWERKQRELRALGIEDKKVNQKAREWRNRLNRFKPKPDDVAFII